MNHCKCKIDFKRCALDVNNSSLGWEIPFEKDRWYQYITTQHEETGIIIYHVGDDSSIIDGCGQEVLAFSSIPFTEIKFKQFFDNIQQERENKLNQLLN